MRYYIYLFGSFWADFTFSQASLTVVGLLCSICWFRPCINKHGNRRYTPTSHIHGFGQILIVLQVSLFHRSKIRNRPHIRTGPASHSNRFRLLQFLREVGRASIRCVTFLKNWSCFEAAFSGYDLADKVHLRRYLHAQVAISVYFAGRAPLASITLLVRPCIAHRKTKLPQSLTARDGNGMPISNLQVQIAKCLRPSIVKPCFLWLELCTVCLLCFFRGSQARSVSHQIQETFGRTKPVSTRTHKQTSHWGDLGLYPLSLGGIIVTCYIHDFGLYH